MSEVIGFPVCKEADNIICNGPLRLRWGDWRTPHPLLVHVQSAAIYEDFRTEALASGQDPAAQMPAGFTLDGGMTDTAMGLLRHRDNESSLIGVTYLSILMETLVNTPCAILRTDLIRRVYQEVDQLSKELNLRWRGRAGHFMLAMNEDATQPGHFERLVAPISDLQVLFTTLRHHAGDRYQSLKKSYVFYFPRRAGVG